MTLIFIYCACVWCALLGRWWSCVAVLSSMSTPLGDIQYGSQFDNTSASVDEDNVRSAVQQRRCLGLKYKLLCPSNRSIMIILVMALLTSLENRSIDWFLSVNEFKLFPKQSYGTKHIVESVVIILVPYVLGYMLYPIAGLIADVYCGRFRTVMFSVCLTWIGYLLCALVLVATLSYSNQRLIVLPMLLIPYLGLAGFEANIIQLGGDQLQGSSSESLRSFVRWLTMAAVFGGASGGAMCDLLFCLFGNLEQTISIYLLTVSIFVVFLLCFSSFCISKYFSEEPTETTNPYRVVWQAINFARKHKYPVLRSAFTYCEESIPSRLDLAKDKYGGPFKNEEVENVKTFLNLLKVLAIMALCFVVLPEHTITPLFYQHFVANSTSCSAGNIAMNSKITDFIILGCSCAIYEFLLYPVFGVQMPTILKRFGVGLVLNVISCILLLMLDAIGHHLEASSTPCIFLLPFNNQNETSAVVYVNYGVVVPKTLSLLAMLTIYTSAFQFIMAQAPFSMRGVLIGLFYFFHGVYTVIGYSIVLPFAIPFQANSTTRLSVSCGTGYYLSNTVLAAIILVLFVLVARKYKYRQRDDPGDERVYLFVEEYYSRAVNTPD